jgi:inorganic pyrophosphatase
MLRHVGVHVKGHVGSSDYRAFLSVSGTTRSFWHDIPLFGNTNNVIRYVSEIPKGNNAKFEIALEEPGNPIRQDINKDGSLRFFKAGPIPFNYGCAPQTWENPNVKDDRTLMYGDGDPIDIVEISDVPIQTGRVCEVKVLGVLGLIDQGETDWKIIAINAENPNVESDHLMRKTELIKRWFKTYKIPEGKHENVLINDGEMLSLQDTKDIIQQAHSHWKSSYLIL